MRKLLEGVTIETFPEALQKGQIKPGRRFAILLESDQTPERPKLAEVAAKMGATTAATGMTAEIFDSILARN